MKFIADFHVHSHYSIATSKDLKPEYLDYWARLKGVKVVGTGDFTHPGWLKELKEKIRPAEQGLFELKPDYRLDQGSSAAGSFEKEIRFLLTAEISNIYKKNGRVRKVHNLVFVPDFTAAETLQRELSKIGNITSDGRPILGLDSRDLLEIALDCSDETLFVPAHIWTPWFSVLGAKSGFDSIEECYEDLAGHIYAVETGLSSDPPMNWICSFLDNYTLISNSDAHSPGKLGREANLFETGLSYSEIIDAVKSGRPDRFPGTIEFFPQEGKYHYDGHRKCGLCWDPLETLKHGGICPVCGKKVTVGVMSRVGELADRDNLSERGERPPFYSLIPLKEILAEILGTGPQSKKISQAYTSILQKAGSEFDILLNLPLEEIEKAGNELLAEAVKRMRNREVFIEEGFDGEYGRIKTFQENENKSFKSQELLFKDLIQEQPARKPKRALFNFDLEEYRRLRELTARQEPPRELEPALFPRQTDITTGLNIEQQKAAGHFRGPALIIAGPGTGKTRTLTFRIANLIQNRGIKPESILAVTFTNKAADEMKERLKALLDDAAVLSRPTVSTFHAFGLSILKSYCRKLGREEPFSILDEEDRKRILCEEILPEKDRTEKTNIFSTAITKVKQNLLSATEMTPGPLPEIFNKYELFLKSQNTFDLDDLIYLPVKLFSEEPAVLADYRKKIGWILIDEYQDINFAQYRMMKMLRPNKNANICVIGDPNQAIYGFRGAEVKFINRFIDDYPEAAVYTLKKSYRCSQCILQASSQVIQDGPGGRGSLLQGLSQGVKINIVENGTEKSEAEFVARTIESMMGGLRFFSMDSQISGGDRVREIESLSDFAVLCRTARQMEAIEKAFNDHSIPYQKIGDSSFFKKEPVKSVIDLMKLLINHQNRFLRNKLIDKKIISDETLLELSEQSRGRPVREIIGKILASCFCAGSAENEPSLKRLLDLAAGFGADPEDFVRFAVLGVGVDMYRPNAENVALMTLHSSKGLEFECVFITGCEDRLLPYSLFENQESDYQEERRLFYVGMTRARRFLFLTHARKRYLFGREYRLDKSPFLAGIEEELTEQSTAEYRKRKTKEDAQLSLGF